jgi:hypothetical protein
VLKPRIVVSAVNLSETWRHMRAVLFCPVVGPMIVVCYKHSASNQYTISDMYRSHRCNMYCISPTKIASTVAD